MPLTTGEYSTRRQRARLRQRPDRALTWHWGVRDCEVRSGLIMETDPWYCETSIAILNKEVRWYLETVLCKPSISVWVYICLTSSLNRFCFNAIHLLRHPTSSLFILRFVIHHSRLKYISPVIYRISSAFDIADHRTRGTHDRRHQWRTLTLVGGTNLG